MKTNQKQGPMGKLPGYTWVVIKGEGMYLRKGTKPPKVAVKKTRYGTATTVEL